MLLRLLILKREIILDYQDGSNLISIGPSEQRFFSCWRWKKGGRMSRDWMYAEDPVHLCCLENEVAGLIRGVSGQGAQWVSKRTARKQVGTSAWTWVLPTTSKERGPADALITPCETLLQQGPSLRHTTSRPLPYRTARKHMGIVLSQYISDVWSPPWSGLQGLRALLFKTTAVTANLSSSYFQT